MASILDRDHLINNLINRIDDLERRLADLERTAITGDVPDLADVVALEAEYAAHDHSAGDPTQVDHGDLEGLADDDHGQYLNTTRHDTTVRHSLGSVVAHDAHGSLSGVTSDQHHARQHSITAAADHTIGGAALDVVGKTAAGALGLITPTNSPGAAAALLRSAADGSIQLVKLIINGANDVFEIYANYGHVVFYETDQGNKAWRFEVTGTHFQFTEVGVQTAFICYAGGNTKIASCLGVNVYPGSAQLHVDQASATGAKPALILDQADVDQVLMKIIATAEAASADRTLVAASDFGTPGALVGWIQVNIQDDGNRIADGDFYLPFYAAPSA